MNVDQAIKRLRRTGTDKEAWETFYLEIFPVLRNYVGSLLLSFKVDPASSAEDLVHESLLSFLEQWPALRSRINSKKDAVAYLKTSCRNKLIDRYRHERRANQLMDFLNLRFERAYETQTELHKSLFIKEIIGQLPIECGQLLSEYVMQDITLAELAEKKDLVPAALYARWYRCIERARAIFLQRNAQPKRS